MKTLIFSVLAALAFAVPVKAQVQTEGVAQQFASTGTCVSIAISSAGTTGGGTQVNVSTNTLYRAVSVQDRDSTYNLFCSDNVNVSSQAAAGTLSAATGWEIPANLGASSFIIFPGEAWYCVNDSTSKTTNATICKGH